LWLLVNNSITMHVTSPPEQHGLLSSGRTHAALCDWKHGLSCCVCMQVIAQLWLQSTCVPRFMVQMRQPMPPTGITHTVHGDAASCGTCRCTLRQCCASRQQLRAGAILLSTPHSELQGSDVAIAGVPHDTPSAVCGSVLLAVSVP
jgi:hypothetical protein